MCAGCSCGADPHPILGLRVTGFMGAVGDQVTMDPDGTLIYLNTFSRVCPSPGRLGGGVYNAARNPGPS